MQSPYLALTGKNKPETFLLLNSSFKGADVLFPHFLPFTTLYLVLVLQFYWLFHICLSHIYLRSRGTVFHLSFSRCRFQIDFIKGSDVVFHLNPRFHEQTIVRNSNLAGCWGPEEREGGFPFVPGQRFEVKCSSVMNIQVCFITISHTRTHKFKVIHSGNTQTAVIITY